MADFLDILVGKAYETMEGTAYNRYRERVAPDPDQGPVFYEVALPANPSWGYLRDSVYPRYARYLKSKKVEPDESRGVVVVVFHGERCSLLHGKDFMDLYREMEGLNASALHFRVLQWLS